VNVILYVCDKQTKLKLSRFFTFAGQVDIVLEAVAVSTTMSYKSENTRKVSDTDSRIYRPDGTSI